MDMSMVFPSSSVRCSHSSFLVHWPSVLSFARGIASEDLDHPNVWRLHESETHVQTQHPEDVLQGTQWMHSMTAQTRGICGKWLNLEVTVGFAVSASKCSQILSAQNDRSQGANVYRFQSDWPNVAPHDCSVWFASPLRAIFQRLVVKRFQAQPHANWTSFRWWWWWCEKWALTRNLTQSMDLDAKFDGHGHGSVFSIPAVQLFLSNETPVCVEGR